MAKKYTFDLINKVVVIREFTGENSDSMAQTHIDLFDIDSITFDCIYTTIDNNITLDQLNVIVGGIFRLSMKVENTTIHDVDGADYELNDSTLRTLFNSIYTKQTTYKVLS